MMRRRRLAIASVAALLLAALPARAQESLDATLAAWRTRADLPALAAAVVREGRIVASGAVGTRREGFEIPVSVSDRFHIGSDTKAMTALVAATLVEEGRLRFDSTLGEVFPELAGTMDPGFSKVTLQQLLSHTSGLPSDDEAFGELLGKAALREENLDDVRRWMLEEQAPVPLEAKAGTRFAYSNLGYTLAGAMLERAGGKTWEELVVERVFTPLGLSSAGFGPASSPGRVDAPLGHLDVGGKRQAFLAGPGADNPAVIGPAGTVHLSVLDFARWAGWNAGEGRREPRLVKPETLKKLHTPVIQMPEKKDAAPGTPARGGYGLGWGQLEVEWSKEPFGFHGGSNTRNLAHVWIQPSHDFAMVVVTNVAGAQADEALFGVAKELYAKYGAGDAAR